MLALEKEQQSFLGIRSTFIAFHAYGNGLIVFIGGFLEQNMATNRKHGLTMIIVALLWQ
jgi:hypothetical protein